MSGLCTIIMPALIPKLNSLSFTQHRAVSYSCSSTSGYGHGSGNDAFVEGVLSSSYRGCAGDRVLIGIAIGGLPSEAVRTEG